MQEANTENFSEKKVQRGRPRSFACLDEAGDGLGFFDGKDTRRNQLNHLWAWEALSALMDATKRRWPNMDHDPNWPFAWLMRHDPSESKQYKWAMGKFRSVVLMAELGRLNDPKLIVRLAREICKQKPNCIDAIHWVRGIRLRGRGKGR